MWGHMRRKGLGKSNCYLKGCPLGLMVNFILENIWFSYLFYFNNPLIDFVWKICLIFLLTSRLNLCFHHVQLINIMFNSLGKSCHVMFILFTNLYTWVICTICLYECEYFSYELIYICVWLLGDILSRTLIQFANLYSHVLFYCGYLIYGFGFRFGGMSMRPLATRSIAKRNLSTNSSLVFRGITLGLCTRMLRS